MAKAGRSNLIEQHAEKGLLVLALVALVFVLFRYVTSSPRKFKPPPTISPKPLAPEQIDRRLLGKAKEIEKGMVDFDPDTTPIPDPTAEILERRRVAFGGTTDPYLQLWRGPYVAIENPRRMPEIIPPPKPEGVKLVPIDIAPAAPLVSLQRELPDRADPSDVAAHVATTFAWKDLQDKWDKAFERTRFRPPLVVLSVQAEVRERVIGGEWGPPRPAAATTPPLSLSVGGQQRILRLPGDLPKVPLYEPDGSNLQEVKETIALLGSLQRPVLQPEWYWIWWPGYGYVDWKIHLPATSVSQEYARKLEAGEVRGPSPRGRTVPPRSSVGPARGPLPRRPVIAPVPEEYEEPRPTRPPPARTAPPRAVPPRRTREPTRSRIPPELERSGVRPRPTPKPRPKPVRQPIRKPEETIEYEDPGEPTPVPPLQDQIKEGTVVVWFHQDTELESRKEYQFRLRLEFLNPLYMREQEVENIADARVISLLSPFSGWSAPVSVPQATDFYLAGAMAQDRYVRVNVFAFCFGERVSHTFKVYEGQPVGEKVVVKVPNPALRSRQAQGARPRAAGGETKPPPAVVEKEVDFSTGSVAVELDFDKAYDRPGLGPGRTVEMLYMDYRGRLLRRTLAVDQVDKRHRRLRGEVKRAQAAAAGALTRRTP